MSDGLSAELREDWRSVWRRLVAPKLQPATLAALAVALEADDARLTQIASYREGPTGEWTHACPVCFALAVQHRIAAAEDLKGALDFFASTVGAPLSRFFAWVDDGVRSQVFPLLAAETRAYLQTRTEKGARR